VSNSDEQILIALGANLPTLNQPPDVNVRSAINALRAEGLCGLVTSRLYETPCFPAGSGPDYVNGAASCPVPEGWSAGQVLALLHRIEDRFGRMREQRWGMRTLDLDLLAFGTQVCPDAATQDTWRSLPPDRQRTEAPDTLILPHPRMQDRAFVLVPLADVAPDWVHPRLGLTVRQMLERLPPGACRDVVPMDE
jgi:2-amino-4-hydroxy-6-hydroxymethyldihydropteridine diphosphokinase